MRRGSLVQGIRAFARIALAWLPAFVVLACLAIVLACTTVVVLRVQANRRIAALGEGRDVAVATGAPPEVLLARAKFLLDHDAAADAQPWIQAVVASGRTDLAVAALHDAGNARLRSALALIADGKFDSATGDVVLAKDFYVRALRVDPGAWDAKYNLDVAMRLVRDFPDTVTTEDDRPLQPKKLWTELPGRPKGEP